MHVLYTPITPSHDSVNISVCGVYCVDLIWLTHLLPPDNEEIHTFVFWTFLNVNPCIQMFTTSVIYLSFSAKSCWVTFESCHCLLESFALIFTSKTGLVEWKQAWKSCSFPAHLANLCVKCLDAALSLLSLEKYEFYSTIQQAVLMHTRSHLFKHLSCLSHFQLLHH